MTKTSDVALIGAGKLGSLILRGWIDKKLFRPAGIVVQVRSEESAKKLRKAFPKVEIRSNEKNSGLPVAKLYLIAVKPQQWPEMKEPLKRAAPKNASFISIMAGRPASELERDLGRAVVVAMTNTALQVGRALTCLYPSPGSKSSHRAQAKKLFQPFGAIYSLSEDKFARATALGGSYPAFVIWIMNTVAGHVAAELGPEIDAQAWVAQVFAGAMALMDEKKDALKLMQQIATPGGSTAEGLKALEELDFNAKLREVYEKCRIKTEQLGKN